MVGDAAQDVLDTLAYDRNPLVEAVFDNPNLDAVKRTAKVRRPDGVVLTVTLWKTCKERFHFFGPNEPIWDLEIAATKSVNGETSHATNHREYVGYPDAYREFQRIIGQYSMTEGPLSLFRNQHDEKR